MTESTLTGRWNYPTSIRFGAGMIRELPAACRELGMRNPLLVTDAGLARLDMVRNAVESLPRSRHSVARCSPTSSPIRWKRTSRRA